MQTQQLLTSLQTQLQETQNALNGHVERIRNLEGLLEEQERMRKELKEVKERMEEARGEWDRLREDREHGQLDLTDEDGDDEKEDLQEEDVDDDDTRTIRLDEAEAADLFDNKSQKESLSTHSSENKASTRAEESESVHNVNSIAVTQARLETENTALSQRMETLSNELSAASQLSSSLKSQYTEAAETIRGLEEKVNTLEKALQSQRSHAEPKPGTPLANGQISSEEEHDGSRDDILREVESRFTNWKKSFEEAVQKERQGWEEEREQLRITLSEWEKRSESLRQSQSMSVASNGGRRKRRSKASTVGTSSEESSDSQDDGPEDDGFVSPVTEEEAHSPPRDGEASHEEDGLTHIKRPRSRRRNYRSGEAAKAAKRAAARAEAQQAQDANNSPSKETGGSAVRRRQSWIPFSQSFQGDADGDVASGASGSKKQQDHGRHAATVMDVSVDECDADCAVLTLSSSQHPVLPIVSAAGVIVIGYLAYTAIIQQQK